MFLDVLRDTLPAVCSPSNFYIWIEAIPGLIDILLFRGTRRKTHTSSRERSAFWRRSPSPYFTKRKTPDRCYAIKGSRLQANAKVGNTCRFTVKYTAPRSYASWTHRSTPIRQNGQTTRNNRRNSSGSGLVGLQRASKLLGKSSNGACSAFYCDSAIAFELARFCP